MKKGAEKDIELKEKWTKLIRACQSSGLPIWEFARERKIGQGSLYSWSKRLCIPLKDPALSRMSFVELKPMLPHIKEEESVGYHIEISVKDLAIKAEVPWGKVVELVREFGKV